MDHFCRLYGRNKSGIRCTGPKLKQNDSATNKAGFVPFISNEFKRRKSLCTPQNYKLQKMYLNEPLAAQQSNSNSD